MGTGKQGAEEAQTNNAGTQNETDLGTETVTDLGTETVTDLGTQTVTDLAVDDTTGFSGGTENVGETSVEIDVEELIAELESESGYRGADEKSARKRLEEVLEERRVAHELEDIEDFETVGSTD